MTQRVLTCSHWLIAAILSAVAILMFTGNAFASGPLEKVIYSFQDANGLMPDGEGPVAGLIADGAGNLYGTTNASGTDPACSCGIVFELSPPATQGAPWTETVLYSFHGGNTDGGRPFGGLVFDNLGNLYGTTNAGGPNNVGTVFELSPPATQGGAWTETVLYFFPNDLSRGDNPSSNLVLDSAGNLYGTTPFGGTGTHCTSGIGCGTVFELSPPATQGGPWTQSVLYNFGSFAGDAFGPSGGLIFDRTSALYGVTSAGGTLANGAAFQLVRHHGAWSENILYNFDPNQVSGPAGSLVFDSGGNLYGTASDGGSPNCVSGCGGVFQLSPPAISGNPWTETTLYGFTGGTDGASPRGSVIFDRAGNLYGAAFKGGLKNAVTRDNGTIFELTPPTVSGGAWTETTLHKFAGHPYNDGSLPNGSLVLVKGKFYGTTVQGGAGFLLYGTVFSLVITP